MLPNKENRNVREMARLFDNQERPVFLPKQIPKGRIIRKNVQEGDTSKKAYSSNSDSSDNSDEHIPVWPRRYNAQGYSSDDSDSDDDENDYLSDGRPIGQYLNVPEVVDETHRFIREEESYCQLLDDLVENYVKVVRIDKYDVLEVFGGIDVICSFQNNTFFPDIRNSQNASDIADCFIKHKSLFNTYYDYYFKNKPNCIFILNENKNAFTRGFEDNYQQYEDTLLKSLSERVCEYHDFLESMRKILSDNIDVTNFDRAIEIIKRLTTMFSKKDENTRFVISEIAQIEKIYIEKLEKIVRQTIPKIEHLLKRKSKQRAVIGAVPVIYASQLDFYDDLKKCLFDFNPSEVAECFLQHRNLFMLYINDQQMKDNPDAIEECKMLLEQQLEKYFDFYAPLNQLYKYKLLLSELKKSCEKGGLPSDKVGEALGMIIDVISKMNAVAAINCIKDENIYLEDQGKLLLRDQFVVITSELRFDSMVFLFEKAIVFTEIKAKETKNNRHDIFVYANHIITRRLALYVYQESPTHFVLMYFGDNKKIDHMLVAKNKETKDVWTAAIEEILLKQVKDLKDIGTIRNL